MKKSDIVNLIRYYSTGDDAGFRSQAYSIANEFARTGNEQLAEYVIGLLSGTETVVPQGDHDKFTVGECHRFSDFFEKIEASPEMFLLPDTITQDLFGVINAIEHNIGIHKFLFEGAPGTGKTEAAKQLARVMRRSLYVVDTTAIIDSRLGQTQKNLSAVFNEMNSIADPQHYLFLLDEVDAIALDRLNSNDLREMGRATSELLKLLDQLSEKVVLIATTNLYKFFDKALVRRFDSVINFDRYSDDELVEIAEKFLDKFMQKSHMAGKNSRLFRKIIRLFNPIPMPGEMKNIIRTAVGFSDPDDNTEYLRRLYLAACGEIPSDFKKLKEQGFTVRETEILTSESKSTVSRKLRDLDEHRK